MLLMRERNINSLLDTKKYTQVLNDMFQKLAVDCIN